MSVHRAAALLAAVACGAVAEADRVLVEGDQSATFLLYGLDPAVLPQSYENNGFRQTVKRDGEAVRVDVSVGLEPVRARGAFPPGEDQIPLEAWEALRGSADAPTDDPAILALDSWLLLDARTEYEAVTRVIDWVSTNVEYAVDPALPTSAQATLGSRRAYCVGMANLAVAMLRTAGIPARDVHGLLAERREALSGRPVDITSAELHRFIEVYLDGVGWVYSDPLRTSHFVDAYHIVLYPHTDGDPYAPELFRGTRLRLLSQRDASYGIDREQDRLRHVFVRPNLDGRYSAAVVGVVKGEDGLPIENGFAVLKGAGLLRRRAIQRGGKFSFTGVAQGVYELRVYADSYAVKELPVSIGVRDVRRFIVVLKRS